MGLVFFHSNIPFFLKLTYREASLVSLQIRLISERKLKQTQRRRYRQLQAKIFSHWEENTFTVPGR